MLRHLISKSLLSTEHIVCFKVPPIHQYSQATNNDYVHTMEQNFIDTSAFQKSILTVGSGLLCLLDPTRADMISTFGEVSAGFALNYLHESMSKSEEGTAILSDKPRINSKVIDLEKLRSFPHGSVGKCYSDFLEVNQVTPDSRLPVQFIRDPELAYVMQRYREIHDLVHAVLLQPANMLGEVTIKWVEGIQTKLPMCITGGLFGAIRLRPKHRKRYLEENLPWAVRTGTSSRLLMNVYFEKRWEQSLEDFYQEMNIVPLVKRTGKT